jgi:hypothetical protein
MPRCAFLPGSVRRSRAEYGAGQGVAGSGVFVLFCFRLGLAFGLPPALEVFLRALMGGEVNDMNVVRKEAIPFFVVPPWKNIDRPCPLQERKVYSRGREWPAYCGEWMLPLSGRKRKRVNFVDGLIRSVVLAFCHLAVAFVDALPMEPRASTNGCHGCIDSFHLLSFDPSGLWPL